MNRREGVDFEEEKEYSVKRREGVECEKERKIGMRRGETECKLKKREGVE